MKKQFDIKERQSKEYSDVLQLYRARIYDKMDPGDDRLQVRIIPHMVDLPEESLLPIYPPFFKGQVITGNTEKANKKTADYVWVACVPDFSVGYVIGLANAYGGPGLTNKFLDSYNYKDLLEGLTQRGLVPDGTDYKDLYVQYWNENYLEMVNSKTGDKFTVLSNGTIFAVHRNQIYMRVGTSNEPFSAIRISGDEVNIVTDHLRVKANNITLGNKGLYVVGMASPIPAIVEGTTYSPQTHIKV